MASVYTVITDDFTADLGAIKSLVDAFDDPSKGAPKVRISAANAATLLLAATFEEFIRDMARAFAQEVVEKAQSFSMLPPRLATRAWRRTMETLARLRIEAPARFRSTEGESVDPQVRFENIYEFCSGDLSRDIFDDLIFNENNMRPREINSLFSFSGLSDVCQKVSEKELVVTHFDGGGTGASYGHLVARLESFFDRRNSIAHALSSRQSSGPSFILQDIQILEAFGRSLCVTLESL